MQANMAAYQRREFILTFFSKISEILEDEVNRRPFAAQFESDAGDGSISNRS